MSAKSDMINAADLLARMPELGEDVAETLARAIDAKWDPTRADLVLDDAAWEDDAEGREEEATNFAWSYARHAGWDLARAVAHVMEGAELVDVLDHPTYPDGPKWRAELSDVHALVWWGESERVGDCVPCITWVRHILDEDLVYDIDGDGGWDLDPKVVAAKMLPA